MKRIKYLLFSLLIVVLFIPRVSAQFGIENYYFDITILDNGDIKVKEAFVMNGDFNGMEKIIKYRSTNSPIYYPTNKYGGASSIQAGKDLEIVKVGGINIPSNYDFSLINANIHEFTREVAANKGDYGKYTLTGINNGETITIFNPSKKDNAFYLEYIIKNVAISHNDFAEVFWTIMGNELRESIGHLEIKVNLPNNNNELRIWAHGPLNGDSKIVDKQTAIFTIDELPAYNAVDIRLVFDKAVAANSTKKSNIEALPSILEYEQQLADVSNAQRERHKQNIYIRAKKAIDKVKDNPTRENYSYARALVDDLRETEYFKELDDSLTSLLPLVEKREQQENIFGGIILAIFSVISTFLLKRHYNKNDKEYKADFDGKYFREIPEDLIPTYVEYLTKGKVSYNSVSSEIMYMIEKKIITYEVTSESYILTYNIKHGYILTESQQQVTNLIFNLLGKDNVCDVKKMKDRARSKSEAVSKAYYNWIAQAKKEADNQGYYEKNNTGAFITSMFFILTVVLAVFIIKQIPHLTVIAWILGIVSVAGLIYMGASSKRTRDGNNKYARWMGLKNFLNDFGKFETKDLPEVVLWEKYLVYATVFGLAKKLSETMKVKIKDFEETPMYINNFDVIGDLNNSISSSVSGAQTISSAIESASNMSSGSGGGGGFSGGGGGFSGGGGGGGGRF